MFVPVVDGRLEFSFELGSGPAQITTTVRVDDGSRHRVVVRRTAREGSLELDGVFHETGKSAGGVHQLLNTKGNIFIGNHLFCLFRQIILEFVFWNVKWYRFVTLQADYPIRTWWQPAVTFTASRAASTAWRFRIPALWTSSGWPYLPSMSSRVPGLKHFHPITPCPLSLDKLRGKCLN